MPSLSSIIGQASRGADLYFVFRFLRLLTMKYESTSAYKLGIIDKKGKALKRSADLESTKEKAAYTMLHRMVFKIRRILEKTPAGRFVNYAAALFLLKEQKDARIWTDDGYMKSKLLEFLETDWEADAKFLKEEVDNMEKKSFKSFLSENKTIEESQELQAMMALDDAGIEAVIDKEGRIIVDKKDKKKAEKALKKSFRKGGIPEIQYEEVEDEGYVGTKKKKEMIKKHGYPNQHPKKDKSTGYVEGKEIDESTKEYAKSLEKIARDKQMSMISKSDKEKLLKIATLLAKERKEEVEIEEDRGDDEHRELVQFKARWLMKQALKSGKRQNRDWWKKQARIAGLGNLSPAEAMAAISDTKKEEVEMDESEIATSIGSGGTAGLDIGLTYKKKKEDVKKAKALRKQLVGEAVQRTTFAGKDVFIVDSETYYNCRLGKKKYGRYEKYVGNGEVGQTIREYGLKHPKRPIILQNGESGPMLFLKYGRS